MKIFQTRQNKLRKLESREIELAILISVIKKQENNQKKLEILEAGCGPKWLLELNGIDYRLTGVDVNEESLKIRKYITGDLDESIIGDLRYIKLQDDFYDVIYCSYVLEHIENSEKVLENFRKWLKPGGILILRIPDGDSVYGFLTKITPFWVHLFYKKFIKRNPLAGKPGHGPFPTVHEDLVSAKGIYDYCINNNWTQLEGYCSNYNLDGDGIFKIPIFILIYIVCFLSMGHLTARHNNLLYLLQKPLNSNHA